MASNQIEGKPVLSKNSREKTVKVLPTAGRITSLVQYFLRK